ncbi:MAG: MerR family transcriptional regulator [Lachnospiraceae bacterium]|nr:MerR family transcriptional regulator [Lachnospiraceae bacterium]
MEERYTAGELAELAGVSSRTIRYYDKKGLLKPVAYTEGGYRLYDRQSAMQLQKIKLLQYAGLSLKQIDRMIESQSEESLAEILWGQKLLLEQKRNQMNQVIASLEDALFACSQTDNEREKMEAVLDILHVKDMEAPFDYRYALYETYSPNQQNWFQWVYDQLQVCSGAAILDMGCGHGNLWIRNWTRIPEGVTITVVEKLSSAIDFLEQFYLENKKFLQKDVKFIFWRQDLEHDFLGPCQCKGNLSSGWSGGSAQADSEQDCTKAQREKYDRIVANHLWDFIADKDALMEKAKCILNKEGFMLSTYSSYGFMEEVNRLFADVSAGVDFTKLTACQKNRRELLEQKFCAHFAKVRHDVFQNHLTGITDAKVLTEYIEKHYPAEYAAHASAWREIARKVDQNIAEQGALEIVTYAPLCQCFRNQ